MHRTKENLAHPSQLGDSQAREAQETEIEERFEAVGGETSTEGVGRGFDAESAEERRIEESEASADGPLSGEMTDPPQKLPRGGHKKRKNRRAGVQLADTPSNHAAARSSKTI